MFSVIIPLYNKEISILATLQSVINQSFVDFEILVVNDGSTDKSREAVETFSDKRIRLINKENGGVSSARNRGIKEAKYDWIAFLDGDDLWGKSHLEIVSNMIVQFPEDKVFCTSFIRSDQSMSQENDSSVLIIEDYFAEAIKRHFFWTSVAVIKKVVFENLGAFKENLSRGEDLDVWARIGFKYRFIKSNSITAIYVQDSENKLSFNKLDLSKARIYYPEYALYSLTKTSKDYYVRSVFINLIGFFLNKDFSNFLKLLKRQREVISLNNMIVYLKTRR